MRSTFGSTGPSTTVVVTAYNQPRELALALSALAAQTDASFDVAIADDGSDPPAERELADLAAELPYRIEWVWQPDDGFRKMRAQNRAALRGYSELLLFLDGDCVPYRSWVATYRRCARPGEFLVGGYIFLSEEETLRLTPEAVRAGAHERPLDFPTWWRLHAAEWRNRLYAGLRANRPRIRGGNFGVARDLFERVDGFDEALAGYGKEDSELRNRMRNAGARGISLWTRALLCHLSSRVFPGAPRPATPRDLYQQSFRRVRARVGLSSHAGEAR
ncbi:MAG TPA: glycosyltransferase [Myxococcota bacterium]|nr:glycosyltransferase [Myxococcota bacterium]